MNAKLNELVAVKVMGWKYLHQRNEYSIFSDENDETIAVKWNPSSCLDDALMALEKSCIRGGYGVHKHTQRPKAFHCYLTSMVGGEAEADTMAMAFCLAALRASGVSESEISQALKED